MDIAALLAFLATASFWFWALIIILNIGILRWIEKASSEDDSESPFLATLSVVATLVILQLCGFHIWQYIVAHPLHIVYGLLAYLAAGTAWAAIRWYLYARDQRHKYEEFKERFLRENGVAGSVVPDTLKEKFASLLRMTSRFVFRPQVTQNKSRIYMWMTYWPWSMLWTVINRPIKKAFDFIYSEIRVLLQKISDYAWAGTENDLPK